MKLPITKPFITEEEFELIKQPLETGWLVQGPFVKEFEERIAAFTGAKYAVALNSCTSGQFIMSEIIGVNENDEIILPAFTWISTANSIEYYGGKPVFCDIDIQTYNIDVHQIESKINSKTKAIYPVTLFGLTPDMIAIQSLARKNSLKIVEDCACGLGGKMEDTHCGLFGDGGILSFHPRKSITTGEGGMIITNNEQVYQSARRLRDHGAVKDDYERHKGIKSFEMTEYPTLGHNLRMTDLQGAVGVAQSKKIDDILNRKQKLAKAFNDRLSEIDWLLEPFVPEDYSHGYQTYCTLFKPEEALNAIAHKDKSQIDRLHKERNEVMEALEEKGVVTRPGTHAVHVQEYYQNKYHFRPMDFPNAYAADRLSLALPFYPTMTEEEVHFLFKTLNDIY
ncbi:MAG: DegT/DnrJ/EryC1/StrS family aminotransferase [Bacteroidota bacterium]